MFRISGESYFPSLFRAVPGLTNKGLSKPEDPGRDKMGQRFLIGHDGDPAPPSEKQKRAKLAFLLKSIPLWVLLNKKQKKHWRGKNSKKTSHPAGRRTYDLSESPIPPNSELTTAGLNLCLHN
ncbi:hypothetical protein CRENBAI_013811 [Crenichthys baileyi]|uniref:Uncharacterized protein n=1 Tax=Crenichthys baileyi TaxID=28760 RepID=A0AAV9SI64_9TELE